MPLQPEDSLLEELNKLYGGSSSWRLRLRAWRKRFLWKTVIAFSLILKRILDILASSLGLLALSPLFLVVSMLIILEDRRPVFFKQIRVGKFGELFWMFKFRSMYRDAEKRLASLQQQNESSAGVIFKMKKDPRITRVGRFIRKTSIDELPQLFNVLRGDMSLVGPRPAIPGEVSQYTLEDRKRLAAKPGITCIWQVSGRSDIPFDQQVQLDVQYIESQSFMLDIVLLLKTIPAVLTGKGAY